MPVDVRSGTATFVVATNIRGITVHGKSSALEARALVRREAESVIIERVDAVVPVATLSTGMALRDEHMRRYVFTAAGETPDVRFVSAAEAACPAKSSSEFFCELAGDLSIRGTSRPIRIALTVTREGAAFSVSGDATVKLSAFDIPRPSQLGVTTQDDVKLQLAFMARPAPVATTAMGHPR